MLAFARIIIIRTIIPNFISAFNTLHLIIVITDINILVLILLYYFSYYYINENGESEKLHNDVFRSVY